MTFNSLSHATSLIGLVNAFFQVNICVSVATNTAVTPSARCRLAV